MNTVDTTGAGDSFVGALLCKIVEDPTILEVTHFCILFYLSIKIVILNGVLFIY